RGPVTSAMDPTVMLVAVTPGSPGPPALELDVELVQAPATNARMANGTTNARAPDAMHAPLPRTAGIDGHDLPHTPASV
ncbi:MAG: hypothetical protein ACYDD6_03320, partial [Acidimicrobiales bacterium]